MGEKPEKTDAKETTYVEKGLGSDFDDSTFLPTSLAQGYSDVKKLFSAGGFSSRRFG